MSRKGLEYTVMNWADALDWISLFAAASMMTAGLPLGINLETVEKEPALPAVHALPLMRPWPPRKTLLPTRRKLLP